MTGAELAELNRLCASVNRRMNEVAEIRRESGCPPGASLVAHLGLGERRLGGDDA